METIERRPLVTGRLRLEPVTPGHADELWEATEASLKELQPWMAWTRDPSPENTRAFTEAAVEEWEHGQAYVFALVEEDRAIGTMGLHARNPFTHSAEVGYWVRSDRAGRGLVTEAGRAVVAFAFDVLGLHRLTLMAGLDNRPSQRVAEKLGFRREGSLRHAAWSATEPYDVHIYGLLETDPRPDGSG
jgi:ribosomal-protein-serine acetyltransferase